MISVLYRDVLNFTNDVFTFNTERKKEKLLSPHQGFSVFTVLKDT